MQVLLPDGDVAMGEAPALLPAVLLRPAVACVSDVKYTLPPSSCRRWSNLH